MKLQKEGGKNILMTRSLRRVAAKNSRNTYVSISGSHKYVSNYGTTIAAASRISLRVV